MKMRKVAAFLAIAMTVSSVSQVGVYAASGEDGFSAFSESKKSGTEAFLNGSGEGGTDDQPSLFKESGSEEASSSAENAEPAEDVPEDGITAKLSSDEKTIAVQANGIDPLAEDVSVMVWSEADGQDDLVSVGAAKLADGRWSCDVPVKGHVNTGLYNIHCYQTVNGEMTFFDDAQVTVSEPAGRIAIEDINKMDGSFTVKVMDFNVPSGIEEIKVAVWGATDGQDDLNWYTAVMEGEEYAAYVTPGQQQYEAGRYYVQAFVTDGNEIWSSLSATTTNVTFKSGVSAYVLPDQTYARIEYRSPRAEGALRAAVWSEANGQDDLAWYDLAVEEHGATLMVPIGAHAAAGSYEADIYSGETGLDSVHFEVDPNKIGAINIAETDGGKGVFKVRLEGVKAPSGISKISVAVWPTGNKKLVQWYTAVKDGADYMFDVDVVNHKRTFGSYTLQAYIFSNNGISNMCAKTTTEIVADHYMYVEVTGPYTRRIWIRGIEPDAVSVTFPTWSEHMGQNDLLWYPGVQEGDAWYADVISQNHDVSGIYNTHCYVTRSDGTEYPAMSVSYILGKFGEVNNPKMDELAQSIESPTGYLILVNRKLHRVAIYQGSQYNWTEVKYWPCVVGTEATPTPVGTFHLQGRFKHFGIKWYCWWATQIQGYYYFHSIIYDNNPEPVNVDDATMDAAASHGCIRLETENAKWLWDNCPRGTTVYIYD